MKWKKLGQIFNPTEYKLPNGCFEFAQSPQTLMFDDFIRIYFSTRAVDRTNGKVLSHIAFVDMDKSFREVRRVADRTVVPLGGLGSFDEHGIFPMNVIRRGTEVHGYTCGWSRRVSVPVEMAIGLVISRDDGVSFQRVGDGPVLAASLREPCMVGDGFVKLIDGVFHMWHIFGTCWSRSPTASEPERTYKIGHAVSSDGINWKREDGRAIIADRLVEEECQALPTVIQIAGRYHMLFCYRYSFDFRTNKDRGYRIGHAWSDDLVSWTRDDESAALAVSTDDWDSDMQCYPHVFESDGKVYLLYNGNSFGRFGFGLAVLE